MTGLEQRLSWNADDVAVSNGNRPVTSIIVSPRIFLPRFEADLLYSGYTGPCTTGYVTNVFQSVSLNVLVALNSCRVWYVSSFLRGRVHSDIVSLSIYRARVSTTEAAITMAI